MLICYTLLQKRALKLGIEFYSDNRREYFYSMLYQGGLPMNLVVSSDSHGKWESFVRGLVFRNINFDELNLGIVASESQSMKAYCNMLCDAVDLKQPLRMPFYCSDEYNPWFQFLLNKFKTVRRLHGQVHPFTLDWEFIFDKLLGTFSVKYNLKGKQRISTQFLVENNLQDVSFFTVNVVVDGSVKDSFDYVNGFCRYEVQSKHPYHDRNVVSLYFHNREQPYISESLDLSTPHLLYRGEKGSYKLGNEIGKSDSLLILPKDWHLVVNDVLECQLYLWESVEYQVFEIPSTIDLDLIAEGPDGRMTFGSKSQLYWTEISSCPVQKPMLIEPVYNVDKTSFILCNDGVESVVRRRDCRIEYRSKWENTWSATPQYGEIYARAIEASGNFVAPIRFINVGHSFNINIINVESESCEVIVKWEFGNVFSTAGRKLGNGNWMIEKNLCENPRRIPFEFTPSSNNKNSFTLHLRAPFREFSICDEDGNELPSDRFIPYSDLDRFQYHMYGVTVRSFEYGNERRKISITQNSLLITGADSKKDVPFEGTLQSLFDSKEQIRAILDRTSRNMLDASVQVTFVLDSGDTYCYEIKESPYRIGQEGDTILIQGKDYQRIDYKHALKLIPLNNPLQEAITLHYNKELGYKIPKEITQWGKTLVIGRSRGRICPAMVDTRESYSIEERLQTREVIIKKISNELKDATIGSETWTRIYNWFCRAKKDDIPASSLLDLHCVAQNADNLLKLTFIAFLKTPNEDQEDLAKSFISFSEDLAFQWFWFWPQYFSKGIMMKLHSFIGEDLSANIIKDLFIKWALTKAPDEQIIYLSCLSDEEKYLDNVAGCIIPMVEEFNIWLAELCRISMYESYKTGADDDEKWLINNFFEAEHIRMTFKDDDAYIDNNQDDIDDEVVSFFNDYSEPGKKMNEQWLFQRVNTLCAYFKSGNDIMSYSDKVRRSIIFCYKSTRKQFLKILYNKMSR
jgi:hypothetical protein